MDKKYILIIAGIMYTNNMNAAQQMQYKPDYNPMKNTTGAPLPKDENNNMYSPLVAILTEETRIRSQK